MRKALGFFAKRGYIFRKKSGIIIEIYRLSIQIRKTSARMMTGGDRFEQNNPKKYITDCG
jgi:hypothetical protein